MSKSKIEGFHRKNRGYDEKQKWKKVYLNDVQTIDLMRQLDKFLESYIQVPRIRVVKKQTIETLINEEALLLAKFLRNECNSWVSRQAVLKYKKVFIYENF